MSNPLHTIRRALARRVCLDRHDRRGAVLLAGTGRGGTTWLAQILNHDRRDRLMFEPVMPDHVPLFASLSRRPYLTRDADAPEWAAAMDRVVAGRLRNPWVDAHNTAVFPHGRLIKDIRLNLALPWLAQRYPDMPIVWLLRHPCAVAHSKLKLGWDTHLDLLLDNTQLIADHLAPFRSLLRSATDPWECHLLMWCVETLIPKRGLRPDEALAVCYESLCDRPWDEADRLFAYLGRPYRKRALKRALASRSATSRRGSAVVTGADPVATWMQHVTADQRRRADDILRAFGLDALYSAEDPRPRCPAADLIGDRRRAG